jgi:hypothetical protein
MLVTEENAVTKKPAIPDDPDQKQICVRLPMFVIDFLEAEAKRDDRTPTYLIRKILVDKALAAQRGAVKKAG